MVLERNEWVKSISRNIKPLDRMYRINRISKINLLKDPVNPVIPSEKVIFFRFLGSTLKVMVNHELLFFPHKTV